MSLDRGPEAGTLPPALPDAEARAAALDLDTHVLVMAPAGSGKTGLLVQRMLRALAVVDQPEQVVAITFTNKAAAEIRARVLDALRAAQTGETPADAHARRIHADAQAVLARNSRQGWDLLAQPGRLNALTIDAFCAQLGAQLPLLSGLGGALAVAEDARPLYEDAITQLFGELGDGSIPEADREALGRILRLHNNRLDRLIEPLAELLGRREQWKRPHFLAADPVLCERAEARTLQRLIEPALQAFHRSLDAGDREQLVTLLRQGAAHSPLLGWAADHDRWPEPRAAQVAAYRRLASILLTQSGTLRSARGVNIGSGFAPRQPYTQAFKDLLSAHEDDPVLAEAARRVRALPDADYPPDLSALRVAWQRVLLRLAAHLRVSFAQAQQADFGQLAESALEALRPEGGYGEALLAADRRIRHLLVDEMQDTSESQVELLQRLTADWSPGDGRSLFLVGDPQQSIYAFRKAEVRLFLRLWEQGRLGELSLRCLRLSANFRSRPAVVDWFNAAFQRIFPPQIDLQRGAVPFAPSVALREPEADCGVRLLICDSPEDEAERIAEQAAERISPTRSVAVLARTRRSLEPVIRALRARGLTPACQDLDPLAAQPEVRDVLALAQALWHPQDRLSWALLLRAPFVGLSWSDLVALSRARLHDPWPERIARALAEPGSGLSGEGRKRLERLCAALERSAASLALRARLADRTEAVWHALNGPLACTRAALDDVRQALRCLREETPGGGIRDLPRLRRRLQALYAAPRAGQVQLMTVHKAKGLEFDDVFVAGMNAKPRGEDRPALHFHDAGQGEEPLCVPRPDEAWDADHPAHRLFDAVHALHLESRRNEALRLLYVAITRARGSATLVLSGARDAQSGAVKLAAGSFARLLEPVIAGELATQATVVDAVPPAPPDLRPPRAPRLPPELSIPQDVGLFRPAETRTFKPSEAVLGAVEERDLRPRGDGADAQDSAVGEVYAQLLGTLYHEALQRVALEGFAAWQDAGEARRQSMAAGLRRRGMPEPLVETAVGRVIELLRRTLASATGRWLVSPKPWARSEYALAGWREGRWFSAVVDRCFQDQDGLLWVIDYKTRARAVDAAQIEDYVASGVEKYRPQVTAYVDLIGHLRPGAQVVGALYFVEADRLVRVLSRPG